MIVNDRELIMFKPEYLSEFKPIFRVHPIFHGYDYTIDICTDSLTKAITLYENYMSANKDIQRFFPMSITSGNMSNLYSNSGEGVTQTKI